MSSKEQWFLRWQLFGLGLILTSLISMQFIVVASDNLLSNPRFEGDGNSLPSGWIPFAGIFGRELIFMEEGSSTERTFVIDDHSPSVGYGIRSEPVLVEPGSTYRASAQVRTDNNGIASIYVDFWDANRRRINHRTLSSSKQEWDHLSVSLKAPEG